MKRRWNCRYDHQAKIMDNKGNCIEERKLTFTANWKQYNMAAESNDIAVWTFQLPVEKIQHQKKTGKNVTRNLKAIPYFFKTLSIIQKADDIIQIVKNISTITLNDSIHLIE